MRVFITRRLHDFAIKELSKRYRVTIHHGKIPIPKKTLIEKIKDADGLICFPYDKIDNDVLANAKKLRVISTYSVGYDHIDLQQAKKKNIKIGYTPEVLTNATADLTIGLIIDLMRRITEGDRLIRSGDWRQIFGAFDYVGQDMNGKTLGVFGMGRIGQAVAMRANAFGMNVSYYSRTRLAKSQEKKLKIKHVSFLNLLKNSDIITIHAPQNKQTEHLFNMKNFKKMKKSALIINTARGKIINQKDLISALKLKIISGAALDVFENEPLCTSPLTKMQNVVLAPHIGSSSAQTRAEMARITMQNLVLGLQGKKMIYSVHL